MLLVFLLLSCIVWYCTALYCILALAAQKDRHQLRAVSVQTATTVYIAQNECLRVGTDFVNLAHYSVCTVNITIPMDCDALCLQSTVTRTAHVLVVLCVRDLEACDITDVDLVDLANCFGDADRRSTITHV